ncbi:MAG: hypothetical protein KTM48_03935, partial [Wolbachia endosymbiont of Pissodes strobi]|nr:hypothetical protein [Wolbachia endosymbiont of Pissodes strobi]
MRLLYVTFNADFKYRVEAISDSWHIRQSAYEMNMFYLNIVYGGQAFALLFLELPLIAKIPH